jgi:Flp pilus assembly CpaE family ATPase
VDATERDGWLSWGRISTGVTTLEDSLPEPHRSELVPSRRARVLLGIKDLAFHHEVLDFLERDSRLTVVSAVTQPDGLFRMAGTTNPDATVVCPGLARDARHPAAMDRVTNLMVVAEEMTVPVLREAIEAGARAVFAWPEERDELARTIFALPREEEASPSGGGKVIAVFGARGAAGTTFVASHLAATWADQGLKCALIDFDRVFADLTVALGINGSGDVRTVADLIPVVGELSADHVGDAVHHHPRGFTVLLAPSDPSGGSSLGPALYEAAVTKLALVNDIALLHVPRCVDDVVRTGLSLSDEVVLLVAPDLFSLHSARRAIEAFGLGEPSGRCRIVVNPLARGGMGAGEIEEILGIPPSAGIRFDATVGRVQDRGQLLPPKSRGAARDLRALSKLLAPSREARRAG